jgi:hypothetical protein
LRLGKVWHNQDCFHGQSVVKIRRVSKSGANGLLAVLPILIISQYNRQVDKMDDQTTGYVEYHSLSFLGVS